MKRKLKSGDEVIVLHGAFPENAYAGFRAKVEECNTCCKGKLRLQMVDWGNNESLERVNRGKLYLIS